MTSDLTGALEVSHIMRYTYTYTLLSLLYYATEYRWLYVDRTNGRAYATVLRLSMSVVCDVCIVAERCVIEQKLLMTDIGSRICGIDWYQNE